MKKRDILGIIIVLLALIGWRTRMFMPLVDPKENAVSAINHPQKLPALVKAVTPSRPTQNRDKQTSPNTPVTTATRGRGMLLPTQIPNRRVQLAGLISDLNDKDIDFYGKVVDQNGVAIPDVKVTGSVIYNAERGSGVQEAHTVTDSKGMFEFHGMKGRTFDYHLEKVGYETMPERDAFDYTELVPENKRFHPDPQNPVVLKMWKLQGAELMIKGSKHFELIPNAEPVRIDLQSGKVVTSGGDMAIALKHDQVPHGTRLEHWAWQAEVTIEKGGLVESMKRLNNMYLAPEDGYSSSLLFGHESADKDWDSNAVRNLYLLSRGKFYSRIKIEIQTSPSLPTSGLDLTWYLNPSGSRNLEFDEKKQLPLNKN